MANESANSHIKLDYQHMHGEERNYSFSGKKDEKSPTFSLLRDDLDLTRDDDMAKVCALLLIWAVQNRQIFPLMGRV